MRYCVAIALCAALAVPSKAAIPGSESSAMTQQQNDIVKGIVVDENGETVIGASALIKGTVSGTVTGMDGRFEIRAAKGGISRIYTEESLLQKCSRVYLGLRVNETRQLSLRAIHRPQ